jgi:hypothetical protein
MPKKEEKTKKPVIIDMIGQPIEPGDYLRLRIATRGTGNAGNNVVTKGSSGTTILTTGTVVKVLGVNNHGSQFTGIINNPGETGTHPLRNILVKFPNGSQCTMYDNCLEPLILNKETIEKRALALAEESKMLAELKEIILNNDFSSDCLTTLKSSYIIKRINGMKDETPEQQSKVLEELMEKDFARVIFAD